MSEQSAFVFFPELDHCLFQKVSGPFIQSSAARRCSGIIRLTAVKQLADQRKSARIAAQSAIGSATHFATNIGSSQFQVGESRQRAPHTETRGQRQVGLDLSVLLFAKSSGT